MNRTALSHGIFNILSNCQNVFYSGCTMSNKQNMNVPIFLHCSQQLLLSLFDYSYRRRHEVVSHCDFDLYFHND